ncbi:MAG TPA: hypothetical protein VMV49_12790 [Candidatus Deferrimicrobium sp.]|nr:hypothetical protein [Candidatus Deferrimicrobium sp.]
MVNYEREKVNLGKISKFLEKMRINHQFQDIKNGDNETVPIIDAVFQYEDLKFRLKIRNLEDWIVTKCLIMDFSDFPADKVLTLFRLGLELNYILPETTFSVFDNEFYIESDMPLHGKFEDFQIEWHSITIGLDRFLAAMGDDESIRERLGRLK